MHFEGVILRNEFKRDPSINRGKNPNRNYRYLIIDEVDSICIDNLDSSAGLNAPFPSYDFLQILYPNIYNTLNILILLIIMEIMEIFRYDSKKEEFIVGELETIKKIIQMKNILFLKI